MQYLLAGTVNQRFMIIGLCVVFFSVVYSVSSPRGLSQKISAGTCPIVLHVRVLHPARHVTPPRG